MTTVICDECLLEHVRRYYPGSPVERGILMLRPDLSNVMGNRLCEAK